MIWCHLLLGSSIWRVTCKIWCLILDQTGFYVCINSDGNDVRHGVTEKFEIGCHVIHKRTPALERTPGVLQGEVTDVCDTGCWTPTFRQAVVSRLRCPTPVSVEGLIQNGRQDPVTWPQTDGLDTTQLGGGGGREWREREGLLDSDKTGHLNSHCVSSSNSKTWLTKAQ